MRNGERRRLQQKEIRVDSCFSLTKNKPNVESSLLHRARRPLRRRQVIDQANGRAGGATLIAHSELSLRSRAYTLNPIPYTLVPIWEIGTPLRLATMEITQSIA